MRSTGLAAGVGLTLCLVAAGFAAPPLYVPGFALLLITAVAALWVWVGARGVRVTRSIGSLAVEERAGLSVTAAVSGTHLPLPCAELRVWGGGPLVPVRSSAASKMTVDVRFARRGRHRLGPASLTISDPLGLCRRTVASSPDEVLVLPGLEPLRLSALGSEPTILGRRASGAPHAAATEVDSLQPYYPGTPASRIHWPTVARTGTLIERRLVADGDRAPVVAVDPREPSSADALDQAMRAAASLCVHLARQGGCQLLLPGHRRAAQLDPALTGFPECHARLALLAPQAGGPPLGCLTGAKVVLWVTASASRGDAIGVLRAPVRYLVSPHPDERWPVQFTVAGCSGQRLSVGPFAREAA